MKVVNLYEKLGDNWFSWTVSIEGTSQELRNIKHVTYILHESFSNKRVVSSNNKNNFSRSLQGWGEFLLRAEATLKNETIKYAYLWLDLGFLNTRAEKQYFNGTFSSNKQDITHLPTDKKSSDVYDYDP